RRAPPSPAPRSMPRAAKNRGSRHLDLGKSMTHTTQSSTEMKAG
ncbi:transcriptional regulator, partial [Burkholderia multivorans]